jgi:WD40 repeat protein/energy-coupling factor transporter ATP-binding protein EcfA2
MLNYDLRMREQELEQEEFDSHGNALLRNPFPGLRPFGIEEGHLFFGREGQVDEVLVKLAKNRFVTLMGYSGSGKSSLIYCGVIPVVYGGFMTNAGSDWNIVTTRPGTSPINNLAKSILFSEGIINLNSEESTIRQRVLSSVLRSNSQGLVGALAKLYQQNGQNTLIFIDQFEELFRHGDSGIEGAEEARLFVNLLLDACQTNEAPIYIAITMRSDYVGECAKFPGLTQMINESNYLVPQMTREQKRIAIEGPVSVGGGSISKRLLKRLLNEIGDNQDQLPIMQHALMRTWDYWLKNREEGEPIDIGHYNAVGKISEALSQHANETFDELIPREKEIAEVLFKLLAEKNTNNFGMRRSVKLGTVAELADATEDEVILVVEKFREPGRSFLMPPFGVELNADSIIEISHESLMRIWTRLKAWVDEEFESAQMYRRLSDAAAMYQIGRTGLWRPPDLQLALNWQKKQKPTRAWARRYDEAFERAIVFLDTSRITYEAEQKNQEMLQKRLLKRTKVVAVVLGIAAVISVLFFVYAITQSIEAHRQAEFANVEKTEAQKQRDIAQSEKEEAQKQRERAEMQEAIAKKSEARMKEALLDAENQKLIAETQSLIANEQTGIANEQKVVAQEALVKANTEYIRAESNYSQAQKLLYQSVAQSMAVKSLAIEDYDLKGLLALQANSFFNQYDGRRYDPYIYNGLYSAMVQIKGNSYNTIKGLHRNSVRSVVFNSTGTKFYTTGTQGKVVSSAMGNPKEHTTLFNNKFPNRVLDISADDQWLINASDSSYVQVYNISNGVTAKVSGHRGYINDIHFLPATNKFISAGSDFTLRRNDVTLLSSEILISTSSEIKTIDINGNLLAGGSIDGKLLLYKLNDLSEQVLFDVPGNPIHTVTFSPDGKWIVTGDEKGIVKIVELETNRVIKELKGQKGRISSVAFSPDGKLLAAGSFDKTIQMWVVSELDELPIRMTDNDAYVWDIAFSPDSKYIIAACADGDIRLWATNPDMIAQDMCKELKRNLNEDEWKTYVGNDIPYRNTCINLLINDY